MPYVAPRRDSQGDAWTEEASRRGRRGSQRIVHAGEVPAPREVATVFGMSEGEAVVARRRVMMLDGSPVELTDTYYPLSIAGGTRLTETAKIPGGAVTLLASLGFEPKQVHEEVHARLATAAEREALELAVGEPLLCMTRVTEGVSGPFQVDVSVFPASGQRLRYDMRIG
ncbi:GntR family transcriptional regulator [Actinacidiphila sp. ITFR-21]|uniref:GntR family transcriptional regulator n=1 Tax=Actinacidiphila sp. ITFR-21 TaxID=3075199 RepID=UPI00288B87DE|nr:UTRA domain-containing protein [Streptomyces sp. ITFR-21]WNI19656.1 UTRA domain-containing protein [Streptomyces sp. ITFR-21]